MTQIHPPEDAEGVGSVGGRPGAQRSSSGQAGWQDAGQVTRKIHHANGLCFLGFSLPGLSKYGEKSQRNSYRQPSAGRERNITGTITQLAVRIAFGQRSSQMVVFACENGDASTETEQRNVVWWVRVIPPWQRSGPLHCSLQLFTCAKLSARGNSTSCTLTCQQIWEDLWLHWSFRWQLKLT